MRPHTLGLQSCYYGAYVPWGSGIRRTMQNGNGPTTMGPKIDPKLVKNFIFWFYFWIPFYGGFEALWVPLGSLLGPLEALWGGLWIPKTLKNLCFFKVFETAAFWVFQALDGPLGLLLIPSWADMVPKWSPKWAPKVIQKVPKQ